MSEERAASHAAALEILNPAERRAMEAMLTSRDQIHGLAGTRRGWQNDHARSYPRSCPAQRLRRRGLRPDHARRSPPTPGGEAGDGLQRRRRELAGPRLKHISHRREKIMSDIEHRYYRSFAQM